MDTERVVGDQWRYVVNMLPRDLEKSARDKLAMQRERQIWRASDLLRLALAYSVCDFSLAETAAWASAIGLAELSDVAVLKRLQKASDWLAHLVYCWLRDHHVTGAAPRMKVRIIDATVVCAPGSKGTDWRLHVGLDLSEERAETVEVTGPDGGETLLRHPLTPGEVILGDRGYGQRGGVAYALEQKCDVVVRVHDQNFPMKTPGGGAVDVAAFEGLIAEGEIADWPVQFQYDGRSYPMRLIVMRRSQTATEKEQRRIRHEARRKKRKLDPRSLQRAQYITVLTSLSAQRLSAPQVLELYRLRWQIEIAFKRCKGLLHLDHLRAKNPQLASAYLYGKILGILILDQLYAEAAVFFPWGYPLLAPCSEPRQDVDPAARDAHGADQGDHDTL